MSSNEDGVQGSAADDTVVGEQQDTVTGEAAQDTAGGDDTIEAGDQQAPEAPAQQEETTAEKKDEPVAAAQPPTPPVTPPPVVVEPDAGSVEAFLTKKHPNIAISAGVKQIIARLDDYQKNMGLKQVITPVDGARHQTNLFRTIMAALDLNGFDNVMAMDAVAYFFRTYRDGSFNEMGVMRFMEYMTMDKKQKLLAQLLFATFANLAKDNGYQHVKRVTDFRQIQKLMTSAPQQEKLLSYFTR